MIRRFTSHTLPLITFFVVFSIVLTAALGEIVLSVLR